MSKIFPMKDLLSATFLTPFFFVFFHTEITLKLPGQVQNNQTDHLMLVIDPPSGRAMLGKFPKCTVVVDNDVCE